MNYWIIAGLLIASGMLNSHLKMKSCKRRLLLLLELANRPMTGGELWRLADVSIGLNYWALDHLEDEGLVARESVEGGIERKFRPISLFRLTSEGWDAAAKVRP